MRHHRILLQDTADVAGMGEPVKVVEAEGIRAIFETGSDRRGVGPGLLVSGPVQSEVPFPDAGGVVTLPLEKGRHRQPFPGDDRRGIGVEDAELSDPGRIAASKETIPGRRAVGRRGMGVRESHSFPCQAIEGGGLEGGIPPVARGLSPPEIVIQDKDDVRAFHRPGHRTRKGDHRHQNEK